ncbi:MAG: GH92 family glycosyl hydrolase [Bacteroidales bacterium]|nr:GH92 family glycosyl hydrolase [Bacteroidales bacterium]
MKKIVLFCCLCGIIIPIVAQNQSLTQYVNPLVGTDFHGHTFPGAITPFGGVQLSPDTRLDGWDGCSAYHYSDTIVYGFSHTHLSGTGVSDYGDVLIMPFVGQPSVINTDYCSAFSHDDEIATPGYYAVRLKKNNVFVELTATPHVGVHRYTFPKGTMPKGIIIDLKHRDVVLSSGLAQVNENKIVGHRNSHAWNPNQFLSFALQTTKAIQKIDYYIDDIKVENIDSLGIEGKNCKAVVYFKEQTQSVEVNVAISAVDIEGANNNLTEIKGKRFQAVKDQAVEQWELELKKIKVETPDLELKRNFYTALYHCMTAPYLFSDVDGRYRGQDQKIHQVEDGRRMYTVFSLWDTYRTLHPLLTLIDRERTQDFIYSFIKHYEQGGLLTFWELAGHETMCMIGYHSVSVVLDAYIKGINNFDTEKMLQAMIESAKLKKLGRPEMAQYGYIPGDKEHESVSKTLEYAYDDWCIAQFAKAIGKDDVYQEFNERSQYYKNIMDRKGFMHPKINGGFVDPFDPTEVNNHFTEANSWQYSTYVPHDFETYLQLMGGETATEAFIDSLFSTSSLMGGRHQVDITGLIGQYAHGNEPSHHAAYLYNYLGKPWKTQSLVRRILQTLYTSKPDGLCGNEDCGQMSAWYVMSALGFYPVCPGDHQYAIGSPLFDRATIQLENGKTLAIWCYNQKPENCYITLASLQQKTWKKSFFTYDDIKNGALIEFSMTDIPNKQFGKEYAFRPKSKVEPTITIVPYFSTDQKSFRDSMLLNIKLYGPSSRLRDKTLPYPQKTDRIYYTLDGSTPTLQSAQFSEPMFINTTTTVKAAAYNETTGFSKVVEANYVQYIKDKTISIRSTYGSQYTAGGDDGLIDKIRGSENFRLGGWQGYQDQDFEATVDLLESKEINEIGAGFLEEIKSWIWFPKNVTFEISDDNEHFELYGKVENLHPDNDYTPKVEDFSVKKKANARYIRVKAENYGTIPEWHLGAGYPAYIFIDEIFIH